MAYRIPRRMIFAAAFFTSWLVSADVGAPGESFATVPEAGLENEASDTREASSGKEPPDTGGEDDFEWSLRIRPEKRNLFLNLNGYAWHFNKGDESEEKVNDWPFGVGMTYELRRREDYIWTVDGDLFFVDSNRDFAAAAGSSIFWRTPLVDLGLRGGLLYKKNFEEDWGVPLGPVLFPVLQWELKYFALKVLYIPPVRKSTDQQLFFQVLIPLGGPR